jgi:WD40 repeat protein/serine/threonine protein kinase
MSTRFCIKCGIDFSGGGDLCLDCGGTAGEGVEEELSFDPHAVTIIAGSSAFNVDRVDSGRVFLDAESVPDEWRRGDRLLGLYEVRGDLGKGGMARVYRVRHLGWGIDLAVKTPLPEMLVEAGGIEAFVDEAGTWVELGLHPNVVACHYVRTLGGIPRVFAEVVEGGSLKDWITDGRLYAGSRAEVLARVLDVSIQFAWGLAYAHEQGLIHQDVKPGNVLLDTGGTVKVTDFGLARSRVIDTTGVSGTRVVRGVGGSPRYYSPEQADAVAQAKQGHPLEERTWLTRRTDVWSWAVSVLEMFVVEPSWEQGNVASLNFDQYVGYGIGADGVPRMPPGLIDLLGECFARDPDGRPGGFDGIAVQLIDVYHQVTGHVYPRSSPRPADLLGASLTNRAVSLLEIGRLDDAGETLLRAQEADPDLPELVYNKALVDWHAGRITDLQAADRVAASVESRPGEWRPAQLAAMLHMERRDRTAALAALEEVTPSESDRTEADRLDAELGDVSAGWATEAGCVEEKVEPLTDVILSDDGDTVVACSLEYRALKPMDSAGAGSIIQVLDGSDGSLRARLLVPYGRLGSLAFAPGEASLFAGSSEAQLIELPTDTPLMATWWEDLPGRRVGDVMVTDDGRYLVAVHNKASYMGAGTVAVWDLGDRGVVREMSAKGHTLGGIAAVGGLVVSGGSPWTGRSDFLVHVWDMESGDEVHSLGAGMALGAAQCMAFLRNGRWLATGHAGGAIQVWDVVTGKALRALQGHTNAVHDLAAHPADPLLISASEDHTIRIWDAGSGVCLRTLEGHEDGLRGIGLSADGTRLVSGSRDGDIRFWALDGLPGAPRRWAICGISSAIEATTIRERFDHLAGAARQALENEEWSRAADLAIQARDLSGMERHRDGLALWGEVSRHGRPGGLRSSWTAAELPGHSKPVTAISIEPEGRFAVSAAADGLIKIWDLRRSEEMRALQGHDGAVASAQLLPDGERVVSGGYDGTWRLWDVDDRGSGRVLHKGKRTVDVVAATPDGRYVIAGESATIRKPIIRVHDLQRDKSFTLGSHKLMGAITGLAPTPDGSAVLVSEIDYTTKANGFDLHGVLRLFDLDRRECVRVFAAEDHPAVAVAVARDGRRAVTVGWARRIVSWDLTSPDPTGMVDDLRRGQPDLREVRSVLLRGDGRIAINGCDDGVVRLWDLEGLRLIRELEAHPDDVTAVALSADARTAISGGDDGKLLVWGFDWECEFVPSGDLDREAVAYLEAIRALDARMGTHGDATWYQRRLGETGHGWIRRRSIERWLQHH